MTRSRVADSAALIVLLLSISQNPAAAQQVPNSGASMVPNAGAPIVPNAGKAIPHLLYRETNGAFGTCGSTNQTYTALANLESPPALVRIVHFNDQTGATWPVAAAYASPTATFGQHTDDGFNPYNLSNAQDNTMGVQFTYNNNGFSNPNLINQNSGAVTTATIPVAPVASGQPIAYYSDWVKINGISRIDNGPGALLLIRIASGAGTCRYQTGQGIWKNGSIPGRAFGGFWQPGNTANFASGAWAPAQTNVFAPFQGFAVVEYISQGAGITLLSIGDSISSGNQSTGGFTSFGPLAALALTTPKIPVAYFSEAFSGRTSTNFFINGYNAVINLHPQVITLQMWSENDADSTVGQAQAAFQSGMNLAKIAFENGAYPILTTAAPVYCSNATAEVFRAASNALVRAAGAQGMSVLDLDAIWGTGSSPNCYQPQYNSGDNTHPNDAGYSAASVVLQNLITNNVIR